MKKNIDPKVQQALDQIGKERYKSNPYLYTRIRQQLATEGAENASDWGLQWQAVLLVVLVALNVSVAWQYLRSNNSGSDATAIAAQYGWHEEKASDYLLSPDFKSKNNDTAQ